MATVTYHHGIPLLGAAKDPSSLAAQAPKAQFKKLNLELLWVRLFRLPKQVLLHYQLQCASQHSQDVLFNSEQLSVGGLDRVRGLPTRYAGHQGFFMRQELAWMQLLTFSRLTAPLQPFLGLDWAHIRQDASTGLDTTTTWLGWACGCKYNAYGLSLDFTYARPINPGMEPTHKLYMHLALSLHEVVALLAAERRARQ